MDATHVRVSVPIRAHESSAFPKNSEDEVLFWRRSQTSWIICRSRAARFLSEKFQSSIGNFLIDLRQARPTRIAFLGGEQVMTHSGEKIVARNSMAKFSYDCDRGVVSESQRRFFTSFRKH